MPPISPCGHVVDMVRRCFQGKWRFFVNRPDLLTSGYHYFAEQDTPAIKGLHPFGSAVWNKDRGIYPDYPVGQVMGAGQQWYPGLAPAPLPPDNQVGHTLQFAQDITYPPTTPVQVRNGFDARCWLVVHPGVDLDLDRFLRPDITDCCWWRVCARLLELLNDATDESIDLFREIAAAIWGPGFTVKALNIPYELPGRYGLILHPDFQIILLPGTQDFKELFDEFFFAEIGLPTSGQFSSSKRWMFQATKLSDHLQTEQWSPDIPTTLVGHSKGAAILAILAVRARLVNVQRRFDLLTFGTPKPGDTRLVSLVGTMTAVHVVTREDIVPQLPPWLPNAIIPGDLRLRALRWIQVQNRGNENWKPYPLYAQFGADFFHSFEPLPGLTDSRWLELIQEQVFGFGPGVVAWHKLSAYVSRLKRCCRERVFPFSPTAWALLFGEDVSDIGGVLIGGAVSYNPTGIGSGGVQLGGAGIATNFHGGIELGGAGGPGAGGSGVELGGNGGAGAEGGGLELGGGDVPLSVHGGVELDGGDVPLSVHGGVEIGG